MDRITLDLAIYRNMMRTTRRGLHDVHERIKEIGDLLRRWTASGGGLLRLSPDDVRARDEAWMARMAAEREEAEQQNEK